MIQLDTSRQSPLSKKANLRGDKLVELYLRQSAVAKQLDRGLTHLTRNKMHFE